jgi:hypothetical protein
MMLWKIPLADLVEDVVLDPTHMRVNFPPFWHYRLDEDKMPVLVGKSHWRGDLETGEFCKDHGMMTRKLAMMFMKLCERYATRATGEDTLTMKKCADKPCYNSVKLDCNSTNQNRRTLLRIILPLSLIALLAS